MVKWYHVAVVEHSGRVVWDKFKTKAAAVKLAERTVDGSFVEIYADNKIIAIYRKGKLVHYYPQ